MLFGVAIADLWGKGVPAAAAAAGTNSHRSVTYGRVRYITPIIGRSGIDKGGRLGV